MVKSSTAAFLAAALALATPAGQALAKAACHTPAEIKTLQLRQLQVDMMVATLKCRQDFPDFRDRYARFVHKTGPAMAKNGAELKSLFMRTGKGASYVDRYMTELSNDAQMRSIYVENYCQARYDALDRLNAMAAPHDIQAAATEAAAIPYAGQPCAEAAAEPAKKKGKKVAKAE
jgi:hypothetical protein